MDNLGVLIAVTAVAALAGLAIWVARYQLGLRRASDAMLDAEDALDRGEIERARALMAPLLSRFPKLAVVQEVAADVLYAGGDPLSAASLQIFTRRFSRWRMMVSGMHVSVTRFMPRS